MTPVAPADAEAHFGWLGVFFGMDVQASSALTRERPGWEPTAMGGCGTGRKWVLTTA